MAQFVVKILFQAYRKFYHYFHLSSRDNCHIVIMIWIISFLLVTASSLSLVEILNNVFDNGHEKVGGEKGSKHTVLNKHKTRQVKTQRSLKIWTQKSSVSVTESKKREKATNFHLPETGLADDKHRRKHEQQISIKHS